MRKGYLLTALAAAVLLAASSGTAWAQSVGFVGDTTVTVMEGAGVTGTRIPALKVTLSRTVTAAPPHNDIFETNEELTLLHNGDEVGATITGLAEVSFAASGANLNFPVGVHEMTLTVVIEEDATWDDEELVLTLRSGVNGVPAAPGVFKATIQDDEPKPEFRFHRTAIDVAEDSDTSVDLSVGVGAYRSIGEGRMATALNDLGDNDGMILLAVDPPLAHGGDKRPITLSIVDGNGAAHVLGDPAATEVGNYVSAARAYNIGNIINAVATDEMLTLNIKANPDSTGFQDPTITLTLVDGRTTGTKIAGGGPISSGMAVLNIISNEPKPTVSFSPTDVRVMEGGSISSTLLAAGKFGAEVGMVKLSVEGDAMVGLYVDGEKLEAMDGHLYVDLGDTNSVKVTANSYSDPDLMDGESKFIAWKIVEADGAEIGEDYWFRVDVDGSTSVPALPLVGQLLLALFLMAGGARLYRRRQG